MTLVRVTNSASRPAGQPEDCGGLPLWRDEEAGNASAMHNSYARQAGGMKICEDHMLVGWRQQAAGSFRFLVGKQLAMDLPTKIKRG